MRPQNIEEGWYPRPDLNDTVADALDEIADGSARVSYNNGICFALQKIMRKGLPDNQVNGYDFVSSVSDSYAEFDENLHSNDCYHWHGHDGEFRRNWCREVAVALRAGEIVAIATTPRGRAADC